MVARFPWKRCARDSIDTKGAGEGAEEHGEEGQVEPHADSCDGDRRTQTDGGKRVG